jgi:DNA invertase Pin-like site-specific DNA recombinase
MPLPTPNIAKIKEVKSLREKRLSYRQIAKLLDSDVKTVYRWDSYDVGKLSTGKLAQVGKRNV